MYTISDKSADKLFNKQVLGKWSESGTDQDKEVFIIDSFTNENNQLIYQIEIVQKEGKSDRRDSSFMIGELFGVDGEFFLMVRSDLEHQKIRGMGMYNVAATLTAYYVVKIFSIEDDALEIGTLDGDRLMNLIKGKRFSIKHEVIDVNADGEPTDVIILEKADQLKKKLIEIENFPKLYERTVLRRIR
jgi:hypothetical protein